MGLLNLPSIFDPRSSIPDASNNEKSGLIPKFNAEEDFHLDVAVQELEDGDGG
jgi:hypothetical protein